MKSQIYSHLWHMLTGQEIIDLFNSNFKNVTRQPNTTIAQRLKALEVATLELLENRTESTVYRIWQTGEVFQVCQPDGSYYEYNDYESYLKEEPVDALITSYTTKDPVHIISEEDGKIFIERKKPPRFKGLYTKKNIEIIDWIDPKPQSISKLTSILRKADSFISNYLKTDK